MLDIIITMIVILAVILLWVILYDSNRFVVHRLVVEDKRIKKNCKAVVLSDLHNKSFGKENEQLLQSIRQENPDFILVAGDILTAKPGASLKPALSFLAQIKKEYPVYYGNGNHEHRLKLYPETYGDMAEQYEAGLRDLGIEPLVNHHMQLPEFGLCVYGAEIDRKYYKRFKVWEMDASYMESILGKPDEACYNVLLAHNPDYFPQYAEWGADLTLSGHVHGGIVRVPIWGKGVIAPTLRLFPKYDGGVFEAGGRTMLLSRGLGTHTIPVRAFNPGEFWVVEFISAGKEQKFHLEKKYKRR